MNEIILKTKFEKVRVVLKVFPYYTGNRRKYPVKGLDFPKVIFFDLPVNLDFFEHYEADDYINGLIVRNVEAISGVVMEKARENLIREPSGVEYTLVSISSKYKKSNDGMHEWSVIE